MRSASPSLRNASDRTQLSNIVTAAPPPGPISCQRAGREQEAARAGRTRASNDRTGLPGADTLPAGELLKKCLLGYANG
ncbi:hypothetical protein GDO81_015273 [Engystomops pustulosus]|uniref:Uncharacterized protein n=1 Tax=Engystomops pustulosus TaxID=76066 RepID=A0AAV7AIY5_ENGPU|nr:hypothetical protein GDO81_015273 [Engystomops pustulosus]